MGALRRMLGFFGFGAQAEIARKTLGQTFRVGDTHRLREEGQRLFWACMVLGDRLFPRLKGKTVGKLHIAGGIVLALASIVPLLLILRLGHRLYSHIPDRQARALAPHVKNMPTEGEQNGNGK